MKITPYNLSSFFA